MVAASKNARLGFTLIELLIVIGIIGGLMAILFPAINSTLKKIKKGNAATVIKQLKLGITSYQNQVGQYPTKLKDLVAKPRGDERVAKKWDGPYYGEEGGELPEDPWGAPYHYKVTQGAKHPYELYSYGPDGKGSPKDTWIDAWTQ